MLLREGSIMNSFKPGDWVRYKGITQISHITHTGYHLSNGYITKGDNGEMKLWQPKLGEWCWFWNRDKPNKTKLKQLYSINYEHDVHWTYKTIDCKTYQHCEPFIGQLPTNLKDLS